jgi:hypothetical protein
VAAVRAVTTVSGVAPACSASAVQMPTMAKATANERRWSGVSLQSFSSGRHLSARPFSCCETGTREGSAHADHAGKHLSTTSSVPTGSRAAWWKRLGRLERFAGGITRCRVSLTQEVASLNGAPAC